MTATREDPRLDGRLHTALRSVPEVSGFPTVDGLREGLADVARSHPRTCTVRRIGTSRLGDPLEVLTIGNGPSDALIVGGVHPNEPIGSVTALHLAQTLANDERMLDETGYTWHIVGCIDPDGMRLNEGWFDGPFTRSHYGRHFYRPAPAEQVEWTFPFAYKDAYFDAMLPETVALMRLIDDTRPAFMCSLHNGELGGVYYYLSSDSPGLYDRLHAIPAALGLPLDTGEPEAPFIRRLADGVFSMIRTEDGYDYRAAAGLDPTPDTGSSSASYAQKYGTFSLVSELPYWSSPAADDDRPSGTSYASALRTRADGLRDMAEILNDVLISAQGELTTSSAYLSASRAFVPRMHDAAAEAGRRAELPDADRPATVAEAFSCADLVHCFRLRYGGMLLRALDAELATGYASPAVRTQHARLAAQYQRWCDEAERAGEDTVVLDLRSLVAVQYAAILAGSEYVRDGSPGTER